MKRPFIHALGTITALFLAGLSANAFGQGAGTMPPLPPTPSATSATPGTTCVAPPAGLVAWWRAEENGLDSAGTNTAEVPAGVEYLPGEVGYGFSLQGNTNRILVPDAPELNFGANQDFSIEAWILPQDNPGNAVDTSGELMTVVSKRWAPDTINALGYEVFLADGRLSFQIDDNATSYNNFNAGPDLRDGQFHHVAVTVQRGATNGLVFYVDGQVIAVFDPTVAQGDLSNTDPLRIGNHPTPDFPAFYRGLIDEVSLYARALSADEVAAIYHAGSAGKCAGAEPLAIVVQPAGQTVTEGGTATFNVWAVGMAPLRFQWLLNAKKIAGATNASLTLTNVHPAQAGSYSVKISNSTGTTNSAAATLSVITRKILVYNYAGTETAVAAGHAQSSAFSGVMFLLPETTNGTCVGYGIVGGKKTYWINEIAPTLLITVPGTSSQSYTLFGDADSGVNGNGQDYLHCNVLKGWNAKLNIGTKMSYVFPDTFAGENTQVDPDAQTGQMKLDESTSTFTFAPAATQKANNTGETQADLINAEIKTLKSLGYRPQ